MGGFLELFALSLFDKKAKMHSSASFDFLRALLIPLLPLTVCQEAWQMKPVRDFCISVYVASTHSISPSLQPHLALVWGTCIVLHSLSLSHAHTHLVHSCIGAATHTHTHSHTHTHTYTHICTCTDTQTCTHSTRTHTRTHGRDATSTPVSICICTACAGHCVCTNTVC